MKVLYKARTPSSVEARLVHICTGNQGYWSLHFVYREKSAVTNLSSPIGVLRGNYAEGPNEEGSGCLLKTSSYHGLCLVESNRRIGSLLKPKVETQSPL